MMTLPENFRDVEHLEEVMTTPSPALRAEFGELAGDLIILGVGGKIGPTLARLASASSASRVSPKKACARRLPPRA